MVVTAKARKPATRGDRSHRCALLTMTLLAGLCLPGCQSGRQWFQMDSNSGMPQFGFDLMPRRTTQLTLPHADDLPPTESQFNGTARPTVQPVSNQIQPGRTWSKELKLAPIPKWSDRNEEESISFTGPDSPFTR